MAELLERVRGTLVGRYAVERELGRGGMATVFLARDLKHPRQVAIKVLDPEIVRTVGPERFLREIRTTASLTHPRILPLLDSGEADGLLYYAMPFLEGESLRSRLDREKQLPLEEAVRYAKEVGEALAYAHRHGVVHRDVKPGNILLSEGGAVVADFGIAHAVGTAGGTALTQTGVVVGTPAYMSPEQTSGAAVDGRSDLYSLGCVLYEMLAGQPPFTGPTVESLAQQHLRATPQPVTVLRPMVPRTIDLALTKALAKSAADRFSDTSSFAAALDAQPALAGPEAPAAALPGKPRWPWAWAVGGLLVATVLAYSGVRWFRGQGPRQGAIAPAHRQVTFSGKALLPSLSPDGKSIAYVQSESDGEYLKLLDLAGGQPLDILGPALRIGTSPGASVSVGLRWSPDGARLLTAVQQDSSAMICIVPRLGGASQNLGSVQLYAWAPDGAHLALGVSWEKRIYIQDIGTGKISEIRLAGDFVWLHTLEWSPERDLLLFLTEARGGERTLWTIRPDGRGQREIARGSLSSPQWTSAGAAVAYMARHDQNADVYEVEVASDGTARGKPRLLLSLVRATDFSIAHDGTRLAYTNLDATWNRLWRVETRGRDPRAQPTPTQLTTQRMTYHNPALSPDGRQVAFCRQDEAGVNLYVMPATGGPERPVTFGPGVRSSPAWSPDGRDLAFVQAQGEALRVWRVTLEQGAPYPLPGTSVSNETRALAWAPGSHIVHNTEGNRNLRLVDPNTGQGVALLEDESQGWVFNPRFSPDGSRLALYWNHEKEGFSIWVFDLRDGSRRVVWKNVANVLGWSGDGEWIYLSPGPGSVLAIAADGKGKPRSLVDSPAQRNVTFSSAQDVGGGKTVLLGTSAEFASDIWVVQGFATGRR